MKNEPRVEARDAHSTFQRTTENLSLTDGPRNRFGAAHGSARPSSVDAGDDNPLTDPSRDAVHDYWIVGPSQLRAAGVPNKHDEEAVVVWRVRGHEPCDVVEVHVDLASGVAL